METESSLNSSTSLCDYLICTKTLLVLLLLVYVCLFKFKSPLQFYVKFGTYSAIVIAMAIFFAPVAAIRPLSTKNIE